MFAWSRLTSFHCHSPTGFHRPAASKQNCFLTMRSADTKQCSPEESSPSSFSRQIFFKQRTSLGRRAQKVTHQSDQMSINDSIQPSLELIGRCCIRSSSRNPVPVHNTRQLQCVDRTQRLDRASIPNVERWYTRIPTGSTLSLSLSAYFAPDDILRWRRELPENIIGNRLHEPFERPTLQSRSQFPSLGDITVVQRPSGWFTPIEILDVFIHPHVSETQMIDGRLMWTRVGHIGQMSARTTVRMRDMRTRHPLYHAATLPDFERQLIPSIEHAR